MFDQAIKQSTYQDAAHREWGHISDDNEREDLIALSALQRIMSGRPFYIDGQKFVAVRGTIGEQITLLGIEARPTRSRVSLWSVDPCALRPLLAEGVISFD